jgi:hypothetical protein
MRVQLSRPRCCDELSSPALACTRFCVSTRDGK